MGDKSFQSEDKDSLELLGERWKKIFALLDNLFIIDDPVTLVDTVNQLLSLGAAEVIQEHLEQVQNAGDDLLLPLLNAAL